MGQTSTTNGAWASIFAATFRHEQDGKSHQTLCYETSTQSFWKYRDGVWSMVAKEKLAFMLRKVIMRDEPWASLTMPKLRDIITQVVGEVDEHDVLEDVWVAFDDGSWHPGTGEFQPHSPERVATIRVKSPFAGLEKSPAPLFRKFIEEICVDEARKPIPAMRDQLQEIAGFLLLPPSARAMSFFLAGGGRNGKSVFTGVLQAMLGKEKVSNLSLENLTSSRFAVSSLVGMRANFADETNAHKEAASAVYKTVVGGNALQAERKFEGTFSFRSRAIFIFLVNGVPTFDSFGTAMRDRILAIPFLRYFKEEERDFTLEEKITKGELPGVTAWAIEGMKRLQKNNLRFTPTDHSRSLIADFEDASSSLSCFIREGWERLPLESGKMFPAREFYSKYVEWCRQTGRKQMGANRVTREVNDVMGKGKHVRHPQNGQSVYALNVREKQAPPIDEPVF